MRERLPDFLGDERHKRMQQLESALHDIDQHLLCAKRRCSTRLQPGFAELYIPVAEDIPDEVIELLYRHPQFKFLEIFGDILHQRIVFGKYPLVLNCEGIR